ncbi:hypothetical protein BCR35DRAFT_300847 [Leucosporidium creatinivorum]|uniref:Queuosine 5'-phosphate N-glycosylase/hydrolase n=1 Tax=Leucosporidium creatinivorum TaxID=106004 RepID=A0A1Y2FYE2_9BASI|nr:hypothetical protein BCR35DRAFT_300847 [Leucosporidium creatinivorum]
MSSPALPPAAEILHSIRSTSEALRVRSGIEINDSAIDAFLSKLEQEEWESHTGAEQHGIRLPLRFDSPEEELNILSTIGLLNFLSGYRTALHRLTTRGAFSTILSLVLSSHLAADPLLTPLSTKGLLASTPASLASLAQIQTHQEEDHPTMGAAVRVGVKDEEAWEMLELLAGVCTETGEVLQRMGKANLGEWVKEKLVETEGEPGKMIEEFISTFPAFRDAYTIDGEPVYLFKKALWLLATIKHTFTTASPAPSFPLPSLSNFPIFADNVLPTLLIHLSILSTTSSTDPSLQPTSLTSTPLLSTDSATRLRAAAVSACARITQRAKEPSVEEGKEWLRGVTEEQLDGYLWSLAKKGELREVVRVGERGTVMY